jgi:hypothetical protein
MADRETSGDAFSVFLTRTAPLDQSQAGPVMTADVLPGGSQLLGSLSDGRGHTIDELRSKMPCGVLELAETIRLLQAYGMVKVRSERSSTGIQEVVELSKEVRRGTR